MKDELFRKKIERTSHSDFFHFPPQKSRFKNTILQSEQWAYTFEGGGGILKGILNPFRQFYPPLMFFKPFPFPLSSSSLTKPLVLNHAMLVPDIKLYVIN